MQRADHLFQGIYRRGSGQVAGKGAVDLDVVGLYVLERGVRVQRAAKVADRDPAVYLAQRIGVHLGLFQVGVDVGVVELEDDGVCRQARFLEDGCDPLNHVG